MSQNIDKLSLGKGKVLKFIKRGLEQLYETELESFAAGIEEEIEEGSDRDEIIERILMRISSCYADEVGDEVGDIEKELETKGYAIVPNILTPLEIETAKEMFYDWQRTIENHNFLHDTVDPHGIYKFFEVGHQRHAWWLRTRPRVQAVFKKLWNTDDIISSFDGCCYISKSFKKRDKLWTHTDQAANKSGRQCYQGFVALTSNEERTLVVYESSHKLHEKYFKDRNDTSSKNWILIDGEYLSSIQHMKRVLKVPAGSLVLWDSRTFHQNQYGKPESEERIVQYVCFLPRSHPKNTKSNEAKRRDYFKTRRTTSHWPAPVKVNGKQPQTYGNNDLIIDYDSLQPPELEDLMDDIYKII